ncbi:MAG: hypothetical protein VZS44_01325 [Bacilli bacterium]|nr:hypothetical protein [Bacilli bacterium]
MKKIIIDDMTEDEKKKINVNLQGTVFANLNRSKKSIFSKEFVYPKLIIPEEILSLKTNNDPNVKMIELGYYPQERVEQKLREELEKKYQSYQEELKTTGNTFTIEISRLEKGYPKTNKKIFQEFEYKGKKYIRYAFYDIETKITEKGWFKVLPIKWKIEGGVLYSRDGLLNYLLEGDYSANSHLNYTIAYEKTTKFLQKYFLKDILQSVNFKKTINYQNFTELKNIIEDNNRFKVYKGITNIVFCGPKLSFLEEKRISLLIPNGINISFNNDVKEKITEQSKIEKKESNKYPKEIQDLLDKINDICNNLPDNAKNNVLSNVENILKEYDKDIDSLKPSFSLNETFSLEQKDVRLLKPLLITKLEIIISNLNNEDKTIKYLERLSSFKKLTKKEQLELIKDDNSIDNKINNIVFMLNKTTGRKDIILKNKLTKYIDDAIKDLSSILEKDIDNEIDLTTKKEFDIDKKFELNISKLYDEVKSYYEKIAPLHELLSSLLKENHINSEIKDLLLSIEEIISYLPNNQYKEEVNNKYNSIRNKYIDKLRDILLNELQGNDELFNKTNYDEIETDLIKELQSLLKLIKKNNLLDVYGYRRYNKDNILEQLRESKIIINISGIRQLSEKDELKAITSTVIETHNYLMDNITDQKTIEQIGIEFNNIIDKYILNIEKKDIKNEKEYNDILNKILGEIINIRIRTEIYVKDVNNYNKSIK